MEEVIPGVMLLPTSISNMKIGIAFINFGASVNIILLSMIVRIGYRQIDPFPSTFQMVDKKSSTLVETIKDVQIQIIKFSFLVEFVILDIKVYPKIP